MIRWLKGWLSGRLQADEIERLRLASGRQESRLVRAQTFSKVSEAEFQVFSQWGEDGIIQYLLGKVPVDKTVFVELGVEDYSESNTRFLLCNDNWKGLIIDCGSAHRTFLRQRGLDWRFHITAVSAFVTRENVNALLTEAGVVGDIGLLSIDLDGNDYWVLESIEAVSPRILVVEYNSVFGPDLRVTIPYRPDFERNKAHHSNLYYGASIAALMELAGKKGYACVGGNRAGNNLFFVRRDVLGDLPEVSPQAAWVESRFRESRDQRGKLTFLGGREQRLAQMAALPVVDPATGIQSSIQDLLPGLRKPHG